jgi:hypothetical protein
VYTKTSFLFIVLQIIFFFKGIQEVRQIKTGFLVKEISKYKLDYVRKKKKVNQEYGFIKLIDFAIRLAK